MFSILQVKSFFEGWLRAEPIILLVAAFAFWYASPTRDNWVWLIALLIPVLIARAVIYRRLWTDHPLSEFMLGFIALCLLNIFTAPYETRGIILLFRPLLGIALVVYLVEYARLHGHLKLPLLVTCIAAIILGVVGLTATEWAEGKTAFSEITARLPSYSQYPGVEGLFNPNELAGAITWLAPLTLGLVFYFRQMRQQNAMTAAGVGTFLLIMVMILGQSLSGILGMIAGVAIVLTPRRFWLWVTGALLAAIIIAQTLILVAPSTAVQLAGSLSGRTDLNSLEHRGVIWASARQAVIDHPLTGIGMAMYRNPVVWEIYPTPGYNRYQAPHAHNEILHIATDLGIPGAILFISWYAIAGYMLLVSWQSGDEKSSHLVAAISAGLVAHLVYGLGDAVPLWDRFAFILYWLLGLAAAQYVLIRHTEPAKYSQSESRA